MAAATSAAFDNDAEACARLLSDASQSLTERDQLKRAQQPASDVGAKVRGAIKAAEKQLDKLSVAVKVAEAAAGSASLSQKELQRRRDIVRRHQAELQRLRALEKAVSVSTDRDALLGAGAKGAGAGADAGAERQTPEQLLAQTQGEFKTQDAILDSMSKGLDGLKTIGIAIRDETDLHMKLLDDLEGEVDKGTRGLKRETARADHIAADQRSCWLYITICLLLAVLIGLIVGRFV